MKDLAEFNSEERVLICSILQEFEYQKPDYSDVCVGDVITAQRKANLEWIKTYEFNANDTIGLLDGLSEWGFLKKAEGIGQYIITEHGLKTLKDSL